MPKTKVSVARKVTKKAKVCPKCGATEQKPAFNVGTKMKCPSCGLIWQPRM